MSDQSNDKVETAPGCGKKPEPKPKPECPEGKQRLDPKTAKPQVCKKGKWVDID